MRYCKRYLICCFVFLFSTNGFSQTAPDENDMTGLWTGLMYNDTTEMNYRYEIAISKKNGRLVGYSHTFFILDNVEYYGVKKIKISIEGNKVITQDLKLIDNNYPIKPPKGVYVINVLVFEKHNNDLVLSGMFSTNRTKQYAPATGYIHVERKVDFMKSSLIPHLDNLGLADELSFVQEERQKAIVATVKTKKDDDEPEVKIKPVEKEKPVKVKKEPKVAAAEKAVVRKAPEKTATEKTTVKKEPEKTTTTQPVISLNDRIIETIQSVNYSSDSLVLTLYDNGEVDGDTVTVLMNGEVIMPQVGLSTNAVRKVIYTKDLPETIQIVMYAETLGSLPPNTGLLIVNDGKDRYEIRFSGDLKKNAAIEFKRKSPL